MNKRKEISKKQEVDIIEGTEQVKPMYIEKEWTIPLLETKKSSYIINHKINIKSSDVITSCNKSNKKKRKLKIYEMDLSNVRNNTSKKKKKTFKESTGELLETLDELPQHNVDFTIMIHHHNKNDKIFKASKRLQFIVDQFKSEFESSLNDFY